MVRSAPGALTAARERSVYDTTWEDVGRGAQELTGLPSLARGAGGLAALPALARSGFLGPEHIGPGAMAAGETALGLLGPMSMAPRGAGALRAPAAATEAAQPIPRIPRQIGPNGMPIRESQPFRNSLRGGSADLREAAGGGPSSDYGWGTQTLYHGTQGDFDTFRPSDDGLHGPGVYLTPEPTIASRFALHNGGEGANVRPVVIRGRIAETPLTADEARVQGYAGFRYQGPRVPRSNLRMQHDGGWQIVNSETGEVAYRLRRGATSRDARGTLERMQRQAPLTDTPYSETVIFDPQNVRSIFEPRTPPPTTPTGTAPFGDPRAYPPSAWEEFGSLQRGTPEARARVSEGGNAGGGQFTDEAFGREGLRVLRREDGRGRLEYATTDSPNVWSVRYVTLANDARGQGNGVRLYEDLIRRAQTNGISTIRSDITVSADAARVYDALERRGFSVARNPTARLSNKTWITADGNPVFEVQARAPAGSAPDSLPMDQVSRMERMREQGYEGPFYHGTMRDVSGSFRPSLSGANGPGVYMGATPETAASYAGIPSPDGIPLQVSGRNVRMDYARTPYGESGGNIMPLYARGPMATRDDWHTALRDAQNELRAPDQTRREVQELAQRKLQGQGYTGLRDTENDYNVIFPDADGQVRNVRSAFAAFDPARRNDPDILAGLAAAVPIPLAAALSQPHQGRPQRRPSDSQRSRGAFDRTGR